MALMISAVILTKNDASAIGRCLEALSWCDERIVIDDNSDDQTVQIAEKAGAIVYVHSLADNFSQQRNFGLSQAKGSWVLFVDADELVSLSLQYEILHVINDTLEHINGFFLKRTDVLWGRKILHGEAGNTKLMRLARKDTGTWEGKVHENWKVRGKVSTLQNPLFHYPHQTIAEFLKEINYYTTLRAAELQKKRVSVFWGTILFYPLGKFIVSYVFQLGFLDGIPGLIIAILMSFHSFLVRGKVWLAQSASYAK